MEPHSRLSQFNVRHPKTGPVSPNPRYMETQQKSPDPLENFKKRPDIPSRRSSISSASSLYVSRPIATNSRVKQDEHYRQRGYLVFVNNALNQKKNGSSDAFDELVDQFNPKKSSTSDAPTPLPQLRDWLSALSHAVSRLERCHSALVEAIVNMPWTVMDTGFVKSYTSFVGMLVSARPEYLSLVLDKIAHGFTYHSGLQALDSRLPSTSTSPLTRRVVYDRIHYLLQHIYTLIPTLPSTLHPLLVRSFPHKRQSQAAQITYIRNILKVTEYCPELAEAVLGTIVDRAIQIDVEIQVELEELEDRLAEEDQQCVFELDPFDTVVGQEGEESDEGEEEDGEVDDLSDLSSDVGGEFDEDDKQADDAPTNFKHVQEMVDKLDAILKNVFDHFNHVYSETPAFHSSVPGTPSSRSGSPLTPLEPTRPPSPTLLEEGRLLRRQQFHMLLSIFDRTILRTFKSRYTQFLVFWYSSLDPEFSDLFQGMLVSKSLLEEDQPAVTRAAAASYIASFVSRAQFVDRESARRVVACLCNFLRSRLDIFDAVNTAGAPPPSMAHHSIFYAVAQAVFLVFCFRWRDLLEENDDVDEFTPTRGPAKKWMPELDVLQRVVQSDLNPLKVCSSNVVTQFARVAHATDFIYCYTIMESNRRSDYAPATPGGAGVQTAKRPMFNVGHSMTSELNTFFPFDPYKLPRSAPYIQGVYREWSSVAIDEDEEEDEDEDEGGADEGDEDVAEAHRPEGISMASGKTEARDDEADGLGDSFGGMSISPYRPDNLNVAMSISVS